MIGSVLVLVAACGTSEAGTAPASDCVRVGDEAEQVQRSSTGSEAPIPVRNVRSGNITAGNFAVLAGAGTPGQPDFVRKIYYVPDDPVVARDHELRLRITHLDTGESAEVDVGHPPALRGGGAYWWPSGTPLPRSGEWMIEASAPSTRGCFIIFVPDA